MVILIDHSVQSVEKYSVQEIHTKNIILAIDVYLVSVRHIYLEEKSRKVVDLLCSLKHLFINKKMLCKKKKVRKVKSYMCEKCKKLFNNLPACTSHEKICSGDPDGPQCAKCGKVFSTRNSYKKHNPCN